MRMVNRGLRERSQGSLASVRTLRVTYCRRPLSLCPAMFSMCKVVLSKRDRGIDEIALLSGCRGEGFRVDVCSARPERVPLSWDICAHHIDGYSCGMMQIILFVCTTRKKTNIYMHSTNIS